MLSLYFYLLLLLAVAPKFILLATQRPILASMLIFYVYFQYLICLRAFVAPLYEKDETVSSLASLPEYDIANLIKHGIQQSFDMWSSHSFWSLASIALGGPHTLYWFHGTISSFSNPCASMQVALCSFLLESKHVLLWCVAN